MIKILSFGRQGLHMERYIAILIESNIFQFDKIWIKIYFKGTNSLNLI